MTISSDHANAINEINYFIEINRFETAVSKLNELLSSSPNDGYFLFLMAFCHYRLEKYGDALNYCSESLKNGYYLESSHALFGQIYLEVGKYREAEEAFLKVLSINAQNAGIMAAYGYLLILTGFNKKGDLLLQEALRLEPENEYVLIYKSLSLFENRKGKAGEQEEVLKSLMINSNSEIRKLIHLGLHNYYEDNYKEAKENLRQAYILDPTDENLLNLLKTVEKDSHLFFRPLRWIDRIGGPAVMWIAFIIISSILIFFDFTTLAIIFIIMYLVYVIYSWSAVLISKFFFK